jgi:hypothetical protein
VPYQSRRGLKDCQMKKTAEVRNYTDEKRKVHRGNWEIRIIHNRDPRICINSRTHRSIEESERHVQEINFGYESNGYKTLQIRG